jgi:hypothetical protein
MAVPSCSPSSTRNGPRLGRANDRRPTCALDDAEPNLSVHPALATRHLRPFLGEPLHRRRRAPPYVWTLSTASRGAAPAICAGPCITRSTAWCCLRPPPPHRPRRLRPHPGEPPHPRRFHVRRQLRPGRCMLESEPLLCCLVPPASPPSPSASSPECPSRPSPTTRVRTIAPTPRRTPARVLRHPSRVKLGLHSSPSTSSPASIHGEPPLSSPSRRQQRCRY